MTGSLLVGGAFAAAAAVTMSLGGLYRHRGAQAAPAVEVSRPLLTARRLLAQPSFGWGMVLTALAAGLHVAALVFAPISVVQAVIAGGLVLLAVLARLLFGSAICRRQWAGVWLGTGGLALLAALLPAVNGAHSAYRPGTLVAFEAALALLAAAFALAVRVRRAGAALLAVAAGVLFGVSDVAIKAATAVVDHGGAAPAAIAAVVAVGAGLLGQYPGARSLQLGDAVPVLALTNLVNNVANVAGGIVVFADPVAPGPAGAAAEAIAFALICASAALTPATGEPPSRTDG